MNEVVIVIKSPIISSKYKSCLRYKLSAFFHESFDGVSISLRVLEWNQMPMILPNFKILEVLSCRSNSLQRDKGIVVSVDHKDLH